MLEREALSLSEAERLKYEKCWEHQAYRDFSPGEQYVDKAISDLGMTSYETVIDFGCGTGRAAKKFEERDISAVGVDIAPNCLETDIPFLEACLWKLPQIKADWGFCTDVMEHIPTEKVPEVLNQIHAHTRKGVFFQIALLPDRFGERISETLHLTVKPVEWWAEQLSKCWGHVRASATTGRALVVCKPTTWR